ncbi:MAG TPA: diacylglycerol kinase family protein, partial [Thermomicrobiales bacterium]|nr:diacylglycerol kinase family protein [Thermomicrobiales bacterium]
KGSGGRYSWTDRAGVCAYEQQATGRPGHVGGGDLGVREPNAAGQRDRIRVIYNPNAGSKGGIPTNQTSQEAVSEAMARHGLGDELVVTGSEEEAIAATRDAADRGYAVVAAAGGDGTVGAVACELLGRETALGVLPLGSVMNIARMLGIPRELDGAAAVIAGGNARTIDVGEAKGQLFFEGGSVGLNAAVFREAQRVDQGRYTALFAAVATLVRYRPPRMVIRLDDRVLTTRALAVAVANGPYTGLGFAVAPEARLDDGLFDVVVFSRFSRSELVRHFGAIAFGRRRFSPKSATYRSARVRVEGVHPLPCRADAHDLGTTPVEYVVRQAALRVVVPEPEEVGRASSA